MTRTKRVAIRAFASSFFILVSLGVMVFLFFHSTNMVRILIPIAILCTGLSVAIAFSAFLGFISLSKSLERFSKDTELIGETRIELPALSNTTNTSHNPEHLEGLESFLSFVNEDIATLQRSAVKFDLFSSDIHFSAHNLADQTAGQRSMLQTLKKQALSFFKNLSSTNEELSSLSSSIEENARITNELKFRALASREHLANLIEQTGKTAADAQAGGAGVLRTGADSEALAKGLRLLNSTAEREAIEARHIGESLKAIEDIVERTHILATNASIEAARAGTRGAGFAVIASEIRNLSASSRETLTGIRAVLNSVAKGIDESSGLALSVSGTAEKLGASIVESSSIFTKLNSHILDIKENMGQFNGVFLEQIEGSQIAASAASSASATIKGFAENYRDRSAEYEHIAASVDVTEQEAAEAEKSARSLAQLAGYLKVGGSERNRVLRKYQVDQDLIDRKYGRNARRESLLYNLEVCNEHDKPIGELGDLSSSGLLLLTRNTYKTGDELDIRVVMPISTEGIRALPLRITIRRQESDTDGYRLGCSFGKQTPQERERVEELMRTLTISSLTLPGIAAPASALEKVEDATELEEL